MTDISVSRLKQIANIFKIDPYELIARTSFKQFDADVEFRKTFTALLSQKNDYIITMQHKLIYLYDKIEAFETEARRRKLTIDFKEPISSTEMN
jgi:hypothetical protein